MRDNLKKYKFSILFITITIALFFIIYAVYIFFLKNSIKQKYYDSLSDLAIEYCSKLYEDNVIKENVDLKSINTCNNNLDTIIDKKIREEYSYNNSMSIKYLNLYYILNNTKEEDMKSYDIENYYNLYMELNDLYKEKLGDKINYVIINYNIISELKSLMSKLYDDTNNTVLSTSNRIYYNNALTFLENVKQDDIKEKAIEELKKVDEYLTIQEQKLKEELERKKLIESSWIKLKVPYISQNNNGVYNGCEAASLLMGLKYKGYLLDTNIIEYSENMPKSDDPNKGFYLSIFSSYPKTEAHWIAPKPLVDYGKSSSGYDKIYDLSGSSIEDLALEILNGNPVIIYLTYDFVNPHSYSKGVPANLHVMVISGYNTITQQYFITDPWTRSNGDYEFVLSKNKIESLYKAVGSRSLVVR